MKMDTKITPAVKVLRSVRGDCLNTTAARPQFSNFKLFLKPLALQTSSLGLNFKGNTMKAFKKCR